MADRGTPATRLAGLEKFAGEVFANSQGKYTLDDYDYFDDTSLFSTASFTVTAGPEILKGQEVSLFNAPVGGTGQGFTNSLTYAETNLQKGQAQGKFPQNQAYVAIAGGVDVYCLPAGSVQKGGIPVPDASDLSQIINSVCWSWNVGGNQSPTLYYEPIKAWPAGFGLYGIGAAGSTQAMSNGGPVSSMRRFAFPLMFPPNMAAELALTVRRDCTDFVSLAAGTQVCIAFHLRGYMLSKIK